MLMQQTLERLQALHLDAMAEALAMQAKDPATGKLDFDERVGLLVEAQWTAREDKRLRRALTEAKLRMPTACVEDVDYPPKRELDRAIIRQLSSCKWIEEHQNVAVTGPTGTGKSFVACALAQLACRRGYRALYRRVPRLFDELTIARADGTFVRQLARFARAHVLVLDDFGIGSLREQDRRDLLEILEDRYGSRSTIITSQLDPKHWHAFIGEPTLADAICDRLVHNAHRLVLKGPSRRKEEAVK